MKKLSDIKRELMESDAPTNSIGSGEVETVAEPLFAVSRWLGKETYSVSNADYEKLKHGRDLGDRWADFASDETMRNQMRAAYHRDSAFIVHCKETNRYSMIKKIKK